jgi:preprotein translocase subunit SecG
MQQIALVIHVALAIGVIGLVLIQHGKGADAGAAFGSGASATVFGSRGSASFLTRLTTILAGLFFLTSMTLFYLAAQRDGGLGSVTDGIVTEQVAPPASDLPGGVPESTAVEELPAAAEESLPKPAE